MTNDQLADLAVRAAAAATKFVGDPRDGITGRHVTALVHAAVLVPEDLRALFIGLAYDALLDVAGMDNARTGEPGGRWVRAVNDPPTPDTTPCIGPEVPL